jgi:pyruvate dehydrogenase E2 component (dihydrolipoamide acetyltransferase)
VTAGEALFEVETDKVTMEVEATTTGYLRKVIVGDGGTVPVATVIAVVADTLEEPIDAAMPDRVAPATADAPANVARADQAADVPSAAPAERVAASPAAKKRAAELGVDLATVRGTGPGGRIQIEDIERAAADRPA